MIKTANPTQTLEQIGWRINMGFTPEQWLKIIGITSALVIAIVGAIFTVNKRSHKIGNIKGNKNKIINGDKVSKK